ncbi:MAG: haloacid dehalogenase-like hydrolase [Oscillospiraceae bacterium]|jgi:phosphoserine phosphatase|nr:haloacid dehalogenase-like hydrolase [Oscillospiraceae bacterium]
MQYDLYDFDGTVYSKETESQFYLYCLLRRPYILPLLPFQLLSLVCRFTARARAQWMARWFCFLRFVDGPKLAARFWAAHKRYIRLIDDPASRPRPVAICSTTPVFLLAPVCAMFGVDCVIGTDIDPRTGRSTGDILRGQAKVPAIHAALPDAQFVRAYSDRPVLDAPMLALAQEQYQVHKDGSLTRL